MCTARSWTSNRPGSCLKNPAHLLPIFRRQIPGGEGWDGDISYEADFLASLRLGDLAFPSRSSPIRTLSRRDAKPQRFNKAISIGLHHVGILPEKTRLICHRFRWYERLAPPGWASSNCTFSSASSIGSRSGVGHCSSSVAHATLLT